MWLESHDANNGSVWKSAQAGDDSNKSYIGMVATRSEDAMTSDKSDIHRELELELELPRDSIIL